MTIPDDMIDRILDQAQELPPAERDAFVREACAGNDSLRKQIELILSVSESGIPDDFLKPLDDSFGRNGLRGLIDQVDFQEADREQLEPGQRIGPYQVIRSIGKGGMGVVGLAERADGQYRKKVALKVVKRGMDTYEILRRFKYERQILARLEHPNIARLLDGNLTNDGLPYFVMEYVDGESLDAYCDRRRLSVEDRLRLFKVVCDAVHHAHRNLVVHRDLKPGNILVDAEGEVKLLDFGIAKIVDTNEGPAPDGSVLPLTAPLTRDDMRPMTLAYAAPEQVRGEPVTPATDVYALGIILYQLLTGRRPYEFRTRLRAEIEEKVCQVVPGRPSTVVGRPLPDASLTPEEVGKQRGTHPKRLRRILAGDLDAITLMALKKEPELRYASAGELAADIGSYVRGFPVHAHRDSYRYRAGKFISRYRLPVAAMAFAILALVGGIVGTVRQARIAQAQRVEAQAQAVRADEQAARANEEAAEANATLETIHSMFKKVAGEGRYSFTARELVAAGLEVAKGDSIQGRPRTRAAVLHGLGRVSLDLGLYDAADSLYVRAESILTTELGPTHPDVAESLNGRARVHEERQDVEEAEALYLQAIDRWPDYVTARVNLGALYLINGRYDEAERVYREVLEIAPENVTAYNNLGAYYSFDPDRWPEARAMFERSLAIQPAYDVYANLASLYYYEGRYAEAARTYEKARDLNQQDYKIWGYLAMAYYWAPGEREKASAAYLEAIRMAEARLASTETEDPELLAQLATYNAAIQNAPRAQALIERALALAPDDPYLYFDAGYLHEQLGRRDEALAWFKKAVDGGFPLVYIEGEPGLADLRNSDYYRQHIAAPDETG